MCSKNISYVSFGLFHFKFKEKKHHVQITYLKADF